MTIEALGTALIVAGIVLAVTLGLPLVIGIIRLDASNKRLREFAAQLASRTSRSTAGSGPATVWAEATLVAWGNAIALPEAPEHAPRRLTVSSPKP